MPDYFTIKWIPELNAVRLLDQRRLPHETIYLDYTHYGSLAAAITEMVIRGAPALGAAGGYGLALAAFYSQSASVADLKDELSQAGSVLKAARPTAVNLSWGVDRVLRRAADTSLSNLAAVRDAILLEAHAIAAEDAEANRQLGLNALPLIPEQATVIHHCNTGTLACVDYGTALGVIRAGHENGKKIHVLVDETRPRLQGARLTAWELTQLGIPHTVIVDGASGHFMRTQKVDFCVVGCDRVAANGDTANKIGTYNLALVAQAHGVPFYVAGPTSTVDLAIPSGDHIPIEERSATEVTNVGLEQITPNGVKVANPAFDVTPAKYITAIITEMGIAYPPFEQSLAALVAQAQSARQSRQPTPV
jgi:methylthioribose-1-phosphate isomerase